MSTHIPICARLFDYGGGADTARFKTDLNEMNKLSLEQFKRVTEQVILWRLKKDYYSDEVLENFAKTIDATPIRVECGTRLLLAVLAANFSKKMDKSVLQTELEKGGFVKEFVDAYFELTTKYSHELEENYRSLAVYGAAFHSIFWRIDLKIEDTKRHTEPEYRILVDLLLNVPGKDNAKHIFFEMDESNVFSLTSCLSDIVDQISKQKKPTTNIS